MFKRLIVCIVCVTFLFTNFQYAHAEGFNVNQLPVPGTMVEESAPFSPLALKGLVVNPQKPLEFQFIVDTGSDVSPSLVQRGGQGELKQQANQLVKYFLAGLTIPEGDLWVNLSPYEKNRMVPEVLGQTELGRDLLAQDYILKQLTASLIYPEKDLGKEFWNRVYAKAQAQFGTTQVPVNTFNKVWILPDEAQVFEHGSAAYVTKATLKVMLDEDYLAKQKHRAVQAASISFQIVREIVIPEITKEVNTGRNFAPLRQIYDAMILVKWYKETIQNALLDALYTNKNKIAGVNLFDPKVKEQIYQRYIQAYKKGVFNYIKEDPTDSVIASPKGEAIFTPHKYFSGGLTPMPQTLDKNGAMSAVKANGAMLGLTVRLSSIAQQDAAMLAKFRLNWILNHNTGEEWTSQPASIIQTYRNLGLSSLLMPLSLKLSPESAQISDAMQWLGQHPMFTVGLTPGDMAMINEILQWAASHPYITADLVSVMVGGTLGWASRSHTKVFDVAEGIMMLFFWMFGIGAIPVIGFAYALSNGKLSTDVFLPAFSSAIFGASIFSVFKLLGVTEENVKVREEEREVRKFTRNKNIDGLLGFLYTYHDSDIRYAVLKSLNELAKDKEAQYQVSLAGIKSKESDVREWAIGMMEKSGKLTDPEVQYQVGLAGIKSEYPDVREWAVVMLEKSGKPTDPEARYQIGLAEIKNGDPDVRKWAVGMLGDQRAIEPLLKLLGDSYGGVRKKAVEALEKLGASREEMIQGYSEALASNYSDVIREAVEALSILGVSKKQMSQLVAPLLDVFLGGSWSDEPLEVYLKFDGPEKKRVMYVYNKFKKYLASVARYRQEFRVALGMVMQDKNFDIIYEPEISHEEETGYDGGSGNGITYSMKTVIDQAERLEVVPSTTPLNIEDRAMSHPPAQIQPRDNAMSSALKKFIVVGAVMGGGIIAAQYFYNKSKTEKSSVPVVQGPSLLSNSSGAQGSSQASVDQSIGDANTVLRNRNISIGLEGIEGKDGGEDVVLNLSVRGEHNIDIGSVEIYGLQGGETKVASLTLWKDGEKGRIDQVSMAYTPRQGNVDEEDISKDMAKEKSARVLLVRPGFSARIILKNVYGVAIDSLKIIVASTEPPRYFTINGIRKLQDKAKRDKKQVEEKTSVTSGNIKDTLYDRGISIKIQGVDHDNIGNGLNVTFPLTIKSQQPVKIKGIITEAIVNGKTMQVNETIFKHIDDDPDRINVETNFNRSRGSNGIDGQKIIKAREKSDIGDTMPFPDGDSISLQAPSYYFAPVDTVRITVIRPSDGNSVFTITGVDYFRKGMPTNSARDLSNPAMLQHPAQKLTPDAAMGSFKKIFLVLAGLVVGYEGIKWGTQQYQKAASQAVQEGVGTGKNTVVAKKEEEPKERTVKDSLRQGPLVDRGLELSVAGLEPDIGGMGMMGRGSTTKLYLKLRVIGNSPVHFGAIFAQGYHGDKPVIATVAHFAKNEEENSQLGGIVFKSSFFYPNAKGEINMPSSVDALTTTMSQKDKSLLITLPCELALPDTVEVRVVRPGQGVSVFVITDALDPFIVTGPGGQKHIQFKFLEGKDLAMSSVKVFMLAALAGAGLYVWKNYDVASGREQSTPALGTASSSQPDALSKGDANTVLYDQNLSLQLTGLLDKPSGETINLKLSVGTPLGIDLGVVKVEGLVEGETRAASVVFWQRNGVGNVVEAIRNYYPSEGAVSMATVDKDLEQEKGLVSPHISTGGSLDVPLDNKQHQPIDSLRVTVMPLDQPVRSFTITGIAAYRQKVNREQTTIPVKDKSSVLTGEAHSLLYDRGISIMTKGIDPDSVGDPSGPQVLFHLSAKQDVDIESVLIEGIIKGKTKVANMVSWPAVKEDVRRIEHFEDFGDKGLDPQEILKAYDIHIRNREGSKEPMAVITLRSGNGLDVHIPSYFFSPVQQVRITVNRHDENPSIFTINGISVFRVNSRRSALRDNAMLHATESQSFFHSKSALAEKGGIDLNPINVLSNGRKVLMRFDPAQLAQLAQGGFAGFTPVIINMQRISSPWPLLGINRQAQEP